MSLDGITQSFLPYTVDGLQSIDSSFVYYNGVPIGTAFVPYSGATSNVDLNNKNISNVNTLTATTGNHTTLNTTTSTTSGISTMNQGIIQRNLNVGYVAYVASITVQSSTSMTIILNQAFTASPFPNGTNVILTGFSTYPIFNGSYTVITCTGPSYNILNINSNPSSYTTGTFTGPLSVTYPYYAQLWCDVDSTGYTTGYSLASQCYFYNTNVINALTASIGTITTLNTTTGTITTLNSTTGTILTMNSNTATIGSFGLVALISILGGTPSQPLISLSLSVTPSGFVGGASVTFVGITGSCSSLNGVFTINSISSAGNFFLTSNPGSIPVGYYSPGSSAYVYLTGTGTLSAVNGSFVALTAPNGSFTTSLTAPTMVSTDNSTNVATTAYVTTAIAAIPTGYITSTGTTSGVNATLKLTASGIFSVQSSLGIPYFTINGAVANPYVATYGLSSATYIACTSTSVAVPSVGVNGGTGDRLIIYQGTSSIYPASIGMQASNVMWFSSPLQYYWYCNGTTMMTLTSTSLVVNSTAVNINSLNVVGSTGKITMSNTGVGAPAVFGGGSGDRIQLFPGSGTTYPYALGINSSTLWYSVPTGAQHSWYVGGTAQMKLDSVGNLLLTNGYLQVSNLGLTGNTLSGITTGLTSWTVNGNYSTFTSTAGNTASGLGIGVDTNGNPWMVALQPSVAWRTFNTVANNYAFYTTTGGAGLFILNNGNVGIGTTSPSSLLTVAGIVNAVNGSFSASNTSTYQTVGLSLANSSNSQIWQISESGSAGWAANGTLAFYSSGYGGSGFPFCILPTGNVGVGTLTPGYTLDVNGSARVSSSLSVTGGTLQSNNATNLFNYTFINGYIQVQGANVSSYGSFFGGNFGLMFGWNKSGGNGETDFINNGQGGSGGFQFWNCSAGTTTVYSLGYFNSTGSSFAFSDKTIKTNITSLKTKNSLKKILALRPVHYNHTYDLETKPLIGLIAQEVQSITSYAVDENVFTTNPITDDLGNIMKEDDGKEKVTLIKKLAVNYQDISIHLIGAVQEQQATITQQQATIDQQQANIQTLTAHVTTLTNTLNSLLAKYPL